MEEFANNNNYHMSIEIEPFEALYVGDVILVLDGLKLLRFDHVVFIFFRSHLIEAG